MPNTATAAVCRGLGHGQVHQRVGAGRIAKFPGVHGSGLVRSIAQTIFNPLKGKGINWLHFAIQIQPTFLISDIRALWLSGLIAKVPECQKLEM